jgi:uncharacterized protein YukE
VDEERQKDLFEDKYQKLLDMTWEEWQEIAPQDETEAYAALQEINDELEGNQDEYEDATGNAKWELGEYRELLKNKYAFIEELFGLESKDVDF